MILRIEDTDRSRHVEDSVRKIMDDLRWLGLDWDEGPEVGGDYGPYLQSERLDLYGKYLRKLLEEGKAYYALETPEELDALRDAAKALKSGFRYPRPDPLPTIEQGESARAQGHPVVVRFKMADEDITVVDEILGQVTLAADQHEDFVIQKGDGFPTYHFACVVDDALMRISHVLRGQEHLINTPKHVALQRALGFATPKYAHMPVIFNMNGSKMSKRDKEKALAKGETPPEIDVHDFRSAGYLPEAVVNFISLLGWSAGDDREQIDIEETIKLFSLNRVGKTNAKFDRDKLLSFNTDWAARLPADRLLEAFKDFLTVNQTADSAGRAILSAMSQADDDTLGRTLQACAGFRTFPDVLAKAGFLFVADNTIEYAPKAVKKVLEKNDGEGYAMIEHLLPLLRDLPEWTGDVLEAFIEDVCEQKDLKMGKVAQPIRVAVSGTTISPSIHDTLVMLGKDAAIARMQRCLDIRA